MTTIVAYVPHLSSRDRWNLRRSIGIEVGTSALPTVIDGLSEEGVQRIDAAFAALDIGSCIVVVEDGQAARVSRDEAIKIVESSKDLADLAGILQVKIVNLVIEAFDAGPCWAILVTSEPKGIPGGDAFLIDKFSARIFPRRFVDIVNEMNLRDDTLPDETVD